MSDSLEVHNAGSFTYYIGGYQDLDGNYHDVENGFASNVTEEELPEIDYLTIYLIEEERWLTISDGPFEDFIDVDYAIYDVLDEY